MRVFDSRRLARKTDERLNAGSMRCANKGSRETMKHASATRLTGCRMWRQTEPLTSSTRVKYIHDPFLEEKGEGVRRGLSSLHAGYGSDVLMIASRLQTFEATAPRPMFFAQSQAVAFCSPCQSGGALVPFAVGVSARMQSSGVCS